MNSHRVFAVCIASLAATLVACGSDSDTSTADPTSTSASAETTAADASSCPGTPPAEDVAPEWTLQGTTGSVAIAGSTDTTAPSIKVQEAPFSVTETQVQTLRAGDGPVVADTATVSVCYLGVNGRDGAVFDSSYTRGGMPVEFPLNGVVPGFAKAITGQTVGSTIGVAIAPADGYPNGQSAAGIQAGDTLVFEIKVLDATG
ncbi:FKBP-type peptidyl-prolyl cis-trans isomerase [Aldersonia kunmingensis]|uniref:FKBP-type peptidyl-prolyl cis-trans isomerase n=1 Tax=Aldersonia kunmingensis TaxID=408066 RepID=UPI00082EB0DD|nr:FKBP-type peptidyl-prolyl cis-trans isomerase [Aldersonia kunmingensis]